MCLRGSGAMLVSNRPGTSNRPQDNSGGAPPASEMPKREAKLALSEGCKELTHWKRPLSWERLRQEENGTTEDEMVGWHHQLNGHEFEQALGVGDAGKPGMLQSMGMQRVGHD